MYFVFQAEDGIRDIGVTGVQTCALPIFISQLMAERAALLDKLRELTTLSVEQRLLTTLLRMATNSTFTREDGNIVLDSSRYRLLCELVGATRESVSLVLARLTGDEIGRASCRERV